MYIYIYVYIHTFYIHSICVFVINITQYIYTYIYIYVLSPCKAPFFPFRDSTHRDCYIVRVRCPLLRSPLFISSYVLR